MRERNDVCAMLPILFFDATIRGERRQRSSVGSPRIRMQWPWPQGPPGLVGATPWAHAPPAPWDDHSSLGAMCLGCLHPLVRPRCTPVGPPVPRRHTAALGGKKPWGPPAAVGAMQPWGVGPVQVGALSRCNPPAPFAQDTNSAPDPEGPEELAWPLALQVRPSGQSQTLYQSALCRQAQIAQNGQVGDSV